MICTCRGLECIRVRLPFWVIVLWWVSAVQIVLVGRCEAEPIRAINIRTGLQAEPMIYTKVWGSAGMLFIHVVWFWIGFSRKAGRYEAESMKRHRKYRRRWLAVCGR